MLGRPGGGTGNVVGSASGVWARSGVVRGCLDEIPPPRRKHWDRENPRFLPWDLSAAERGQSDIFACPQVGSVIRLFL